MPGIDTAPGAAHPRGTLLEQLAGRIARMTFADIDARGRTVARTAFADTLGVALAGSRSEAVRLVQAAAVCSTPAGSLILGTAGRADALDAGLLNGIASHALDFDDGNLTLVGHPSTILVPAVLALGEETDATLREAATAYAAGYEVLIRLARSVNTAHYVKGWHPTSTLGVVGAAAAAAHLLRLDAARTAVALAIALSSAAGIKANFGTMTKPLHIGQAVRNGLLAARLAAAGFTANPEALDTVQGFLNVYNGAGAYDTQAITLGLDSPPLLNNEVNPIKAYACCHSTHGAIEAAREIRELDGFRIGDIERITVIVDEKRIPHTDRPVLAEALAGKFSLQYVVARMLLTGSVDLADFEGDAHRDPAVLSLMEHIEVAPAPPRREKNSFGAVVRVKHADGAVLTAVRDPERDGSGTEIDPPRLWAKFTDCAEQVLPSDTVGDLRALLQDFPGPGTVRGLMKLAEVHGGDAR
ncbi:MmgE/PrpD family protein [Streptomyces longwoodensis]|uniref:MmgE/PrpD family protein n=1 Tax=Streptomyces longwoodensis TaxID=68231 RepID=UPI0033D4FFA4